MFSWRLEVHGYIRFARSVIPHYACACPEMTYQALALIVFVTKVAVGWMRDQPVRELKLTTAAYSATVKLAPIARPTTTIPQVYSINDHTLNKKGVCILRH